MVATFDRNGVAAGGLIASPVLVFVTVALLVVVPTTDRIQLVNPLTVMGSNWVVAAALFVPSPGLLSLAWADLRTRRPAQWLTFGISGALAFLALAWIIPGVTQVGCQPITNSLAAVPTYAPVVVLAGLSFAVPVVIGRYFAERGRIFAAMSAGSFGAALGILTTALAFALANPPLMCVPRL